MRLELLSIALRPRNAWEAMDLGMALLRRHGGAVWKPWFLLSLPVFVLVNALTWWAELLWLAPLLMWWLKPLFGRVPLYVLSRAVFGSVPGVGQTLRARELWAWRPLLGWLTWRRLHPWRALLMPIDLLEGLRGARRGERARVLQGAVSSQAFGLTLMCLHFELALYLSVWVLALMFVPVEFLTESARAVWATIFDAPPAWAQLLANAVAWAVTSLVEPFYISAGFGLYLNRRTQLEAWDLELVFRRLAERSRAASGLLASLGLAILLGGLSLAPLSAMAASGPAAPAVSPAGALEDKGPPPITPEAFIGKSWQANDGRFDRSVEKAYLDPLLAPKQEITRWVLKDPLKKNDRKKPLPQWLRTLAAAFAFLGEFGLWLLAGILLVIVLWRLPHWLPWVRARLDHQPEPSPITEQALAPDQPALPDDVADAARALWQDQHQREALALLYRASVASLAERLGAPFPPGATEAECLRHARRLGDPLLLAQFALVVRTWQAAAYAWRLPDSAQFDALLLGWSQRFGARP